LQFRAEIENGGCICSVISLDDDMAREMIMKELKAEKSVKTIEAWGRNGFAIVIDEN